MGKIRSLSADLRRQVGPGPGIAGTASSTGSTAALDNADTDDPVSTRSLTGQLVVAALYQWDAVAAGNLLRDHLVDSRNVLLQAG